MAKGSSLSIKRINCEIFAEISLSESVPLGQVSSRDCFHFDAPFSKVLRGNANCNEFSPFAVSCFKPYAKFRTVHLCMYDGEKNACRALALELEAGRGLDNIMNVGGESCWVIELDF